MPSEFVHVTPTPNFPNLGRAAIDVLDERYRNGIIPVSLDDIREQRAGLEVLRSPSLGERMFFVHFFLEKVSETILLNTQTKSALLVQFS